MGFGPVELGVEGGGGEADGVSEFGRDDDDGRGPFGEEFLGGGGVETEAAGGPDEGANLLSDEGLGSGEGEDAGEVGGGTGEDGDAVLILLRSECVADDGEDVGGVVQLENAVVVDRLAFGVLAVKDSVQEGRSLGGFAGDGHAYGQRPAGGAEIGVDRAGVETGDDFGEGGRCEAVLADAGGDDACLVFSIESVEQGEGERRVDGVAQIGVEDDPDRGLGHSDCLHA